MSYRSSAPLFPEVGVIAMPYHHWAARWTTPHHVLTRLAEYFPVQWLEPARHWRERRARADGVGHSAGTYELPAAFELCVPDEWLPDVYRPQWLREALLRARVRVAWRRLLARGCREVVLYLWHPQFGSALDVGRPACGLYHIDDEYTFSATATNVSPEEKRVLERVDEVFLISPALMERKSGVNPNMTFVPEGVDFARYSSRVPEPPDIASIRRPRIGYTGVLKRQLDWPLLRDLARSHQEWSFVLVGPRSLTPAAAMVADEMAELANVHFLGRKTVTDLARYPQHFDVCIMPYVADGYTNNIYPLKLHEYLASGSPIVGVPIRSLLDFRHVIRLASGREEWSAALGDVLAGAETLPERVAARQAIAREHDWSELVRHIAATICRRLGPGFGARLERAADARLSGSQRDGAVTA
jgi:glycosyl transferase family 1